MPHRQSKETRWQAGTGSLRSPRKTFASELLRQRVRTQLEMRGERLRALAALHEPRRTIAVRHPQSPGLPAAIGIVDAPVEALAVPAERIGHAQHHHLAA